MLKSPTSRLAKLTVVVGLVSLGAGLAYAGFTTWPVALLDNNVKTGQAELKLCDRLDTLPGWTYGSSRTISLENLFPGGTQTLFGTDEVSIANDGGSLLTTATDRGCTSYTNPAAHSVVPLRLAPSVIVGDATTCPAALATDLELQFQLGTESTPWLGLSSWESNLTSYFTALAVDEARYIQVSAKLKSTNDSQQTNCNFALLFKGIQG
ncbi:MAG: hypothetical protein CEO22_244 [Candidatus Berkelbacteria bacterium Gr01-1014_85]|uniref:Uncharacterized protein n=1 Tax=Candidatus Berkelbacteria bacterium Gr01-1014_85 TaxID=2017150 RepID=A0A554JCN7_9BACT|nr:MAG: hypothetical protein CEO22_244 [Candidatus Berkelbacteria bacterium Gr01-1014_85]